MYWIIIILVFIAGAGTSFQAGVNGALGKKIGIIEAGFVSFLVGTIFMLVLLIFARKGNLSEAFNAPKWQLTGGLLGGFYILIMIIAVPKIGIAAALIALIVGQLSSSTLIDHFGIIGDKHIPIDGKRISALILMGVALYLFNRK